MKPPHYAKREALALMIVFGAAMLLNLIHAALVIAAWARTYWTDRPDWIADIGPLVLAGGGFWLGVHLYLWAVRKERIGKCSKCGYDLTGNVSGVCPECGEVVG